MSGLRIVLFEQDDSYRSKLSLFLRAYGCIVVIAKTLSDVQSQLHNQEWSVYLLNFANSPAWGIEFLANGERRRQNPVVVLSDNDDHIDRIVCLELGADDYIVKTAHHREILARMRVAQRRAIAAPLPDVHVSPVIIDKPSIAWRLSLETRALMTPDGDQIDLTRDQAGLLDILIRHTGQALSRENLSTALFDRQLKAGDRSIDNLVVRLRRRLGESARRPCIIKTARTGGYYFDGFPMPHGTKRASRREDEKIAA
jgi:DNA-binding response OmpR family regulator